MKLKNLGDKESPQKEVEVVWVCDAKTGALCRKEDDGMEVQGGWRRGRPNMVVQFEG